MYSGANTLFLENLRKVPLLLANIITSMPFIMKCIRVFLRVNMKNGKYNISIATFNSLHQINLTL